MCRYHKHGKRVGFQGSKFFKDKIELNDMEHGFGEWLDHFLADPSSDLPCYNPSNMQTRHILCRNPEVMGGHHWWVGQEGGIEAALDALQPYPISMHV